MSEHEEQSLFVHWFRLKYPKLKEALFAIPNGGHRHIKVAMTLKKEGVVPGVSVLFLMVPRETYHGAFIEMKTNHQWKEGLARLWCKEKLASFTVPKYYFFETIPRTSTGKIQKYLLREKAKSLVSN